MTDRDLPVERRPAEVPEETELGWLVAQLERERPIPRPAFRGQLRRQLIDTPRGLRRIRLMIAAYAGSGLALLAIATIGVAGLGPLATG